MTSLVSEYSRHGARCSLDSPPQPSLPLAMAHPKPFPVPAGYPSPREVARRLGISKTEYSTVMKLVDEVLAGRAGTNARKQKAAAGPRRVAAKK